MIAGQKVSLNRVTSPTLFLPTDGPSVFLYGSTSEWKDDVIDIFNETWQIWGDNDITVYVEENGIDDFEWSVFVSSTISHKIVVIDGGMDAHEAFFISNLLQDSNSIVILTEDAPDWATQMVSLIDSAVHAADIESALAILFSWYTGQTVEEYSADQLKVNLES